MSHTVLVAGGAGFIGSHLCERLVERGDRVVCVDDLSTGAVDNVTHLSASTGFELHVVDVAHGDLASVVDGHRFDRVLHLASPASPPEYLRRPIATLDAGATATRRLLELAEAHGARFFLASTSEIYGDPLVHPQPESYWGNVNPVGERSVYDEAKRFAEAMTMAFHRARGVDVRIVRIFNTYGPRMQLDDGRVVTNFVGQALRGEPLTIYGDGSQTRSFCYVDDEVDGLLAVLDGHLVGPVNVGNPDEFTMLELAELVQELVGRPVGVVRRPLPIDDPRVRRPDISLVTSELGWRPTTDLRVGLLRTIEWFRLQGAEAATA